MPFCPSCRAEYQATYSFCADCEVILVDSIEHHEIDLEMGDVYICYEAFEAQRIADMLQRVGIEALIRNRASAAFPTNVGMTSEQHVAVLAQDFNEAHQLIQAAIEDHVISNDGHLITQTLQGS